MSAWDMSDLRAERPPRPVMRCDACAQYRVGVVAVVCIPPVGTPADGVWWGRLPKLCPGCLDEGPDGATELRLMGMEGA